MEEYSDKRGLATTCTNVYMCSGWCRAHRSGYRFKIQVPFSLSVICDMSSSLILFSVFSMPFNSCLFLRKLDVTFACHV